MPEKFEQMLTGGHPNSLGRTVEVVDEVIKDIDRLSELFDCYHSSDEVVRLRTSNAMKRVEAIKHDLLVPYIERFINEVGSLDQPSAQWTLAQLFDCLSEDLTSDQRFEAIKIMKSNLTSYSDWIVLNATMETLSSWAANDDDLKTWIEPHLRRLSSDNRKSVASRASKKINFLFSE